MNRRTRAKFRPLRKLLTTLIAIPLTLLLLRLAWGAYADHHLAATRRELAAAGHRTKVEDFTLPPLPDDQNAALPILEAARVLTLTPDQKKAVNADDHHCAFAQTRWTDTEKKLIRDAAKSNAAIPTLLDSAAQLPQARWSFTINPNQAAFAQQAHAKLYQLAGFLYVQAIVAHEDGRDDLALVYFRRLALIANRLTHDPELHTHLFAALVASFPALGIERIQPILPLSPADASAARTLIAAFLDDEPFDDQLRVALEYNAARSGDWFRATYPSTQSWLIRPSFTLNLERSLRSEIAISDAISARTWQAIKSIELNVVASSGSYNNLNVITYRCAWGSNAHAVEVSYRFATDRHAAAILLAAALFRADHNGANPATLDQLIPQYLPSAPMDRFSLPVAPLHCRVSSELLVWSVGADGIDDGGSTALRHPYESHQRWGGGELDAVYGPSRVEPLPATAPSPRFPHTGPPAGFGAPPPS